MLVQVGDLLSPTLPCWGSGPAEVLLAGCCLRCGGRDGVTPVWLSCSLTAPCCATMVATVTVWGASVPLALHLIYSPVPHLEGAGRTTALPPEVVRMPRGGVASLPSSLLPWGLSPTMPPVGTL